MSAVSSNNNSKGWNSQTNAQFTETWSLGDKLAHPQQNQWGGAAQSRDSNASCTDSFESEWWLGNAAAHQQQNQWGGAAHPQQNQWGAAAQSRDSIASKAGSLNSAVFPEQEVEEVWGNLSQPDGGSSSRGWGL